MSMSNVDMMVKQMETDIRSLEVNTYHNITIYVKSIQQRLLLSFYFERKWQETPVTEHGSTS